MFVGDDAEVDTESKLQEHKVADDGKDRSKEEMSVSEGEIEEDDGRLRYQRRNMGVKAAGNRDRERERREKNGKIGVFGKIIKYICEVAKNGRRKGSITEGKRRRNQRKKRSIY